MSPPLTTAIEAVLGRELNHPAVVVQARSIGGGCINAAQLITLDDGQQFFVKANPSPLPRLFECEAEGLAALAAVGTLRVPRPISVGGGGNCPPFILMEYISTGRPARQFSEIFGQGLAELHRSGQGAAFGFATDNYLGSSVQPNTWNEDWVEFWRVLRLGHQLQLARQQGLCDAAMSRAGDRLLDRLDRWIAEPAEPPCLLHGDLWGGNYLTDDHGQPVLIDPAVYYGRREADLAMTRLFGGFDQRFYDAYDASWPLEPDSHQRLEIYELYHLLNHLNLFGSSYLAGCMRILRHFE